MRDKMREDVHFRILRILEETPEITQRELARAVGISTGSVHYVLRAFLKAGLIKLGRFTAAENKTRYAYKLTPKGLAEKAALTKGFLARKMVEYEVIREEIRSIVGELPDAEQEGSSA